MIVVAGNMVKQQDNIIYWEKRIRLSLKAAQLNIFTEFLLKDYSLEYQSLYIAEHKLSELVHTIELLGVQQL